MPRSTVHFPGHLPSTCCLLHLFRKGVTQQRPFSASVRQAADFTHAVIGGGVVGLAVARALQKRAGSAGAGAEVLLIERHGGVGEETSGRNSEVIHAGIYYPPTSLKTTLCLRGAELLYAHCHSHRIPHRRTGKWIVAQTPSEHAALDSLATHCATLGVPTRFLGRQERTRREPDVRAAEAALESERTGIVDSHALMMSLLGEFETEGGTAAFRTALQSVAPVKGGKGGWELRTFPTTSSSSSSSSDTNNKDVSTITASTLINCAGLGAHALSNSILPASHPMNRPPLFAKGTYYTLVPPSSSSSLSQTPVPKPKVSTLIYPAPSLSLAGLGTHLTLDLQGELRFGPDVEWVHDPNNLSVPDPDSSSPSSSPSAPHSHKQNDEATRKLRAATRQVSRYLPAVAAAADPAAAAVMEEGRRWRLVPAWAGIRPKLGRGASAAGRTPGSSGSSGSGKVADEDEEEEEDGDGDEDSAPAALTTAAAATAGSSSSSCSSSTSDNSSNSRAEKSGAGKGFNDFYIVREEGFGGSFVNLLGIESPGLTSALGIGEYVVRLLYDR